MTRYLIAIHHPDDFDPSRVDEAMVRDIDALNEEMDAKGMRIFAGGLCPASRAKSLRAQPDGKVLITDGPYLGKTGGKTERSPVFDEWKLLNVSSVPEFLSVEGNPVNNGVVFWILAVAYDLAVKILSDAPAGGIFYGHRIDETFLVKSCVPPLNKCGYDFPAKTLPVCAFLEPKAELGRNRIRVFQRGHANAFPVVEPPDDERKSVRFRSLHPLLASRHVLAPRWRLPWHEFSDGGRDASKNVLCIQHLELAELQSWGLNDNHHVSLLTTDNTSRIKGEGLAK